MWDFNLVVTMTGGGRYHELWQELAGHGEFHKTEFFGVLLGRVQDPAGFLEVVHSARCHDEAAFTDLGRIVPLDLCFTFTPATFAERVKEALTPYAAELAGERFYVRLERRGLKGRIISPEVEREFDAYLLTLIQQAGKTAQVGFDNTDTVLAVETVGERCGVGRLTRSLRDRYPFVRTP